MNQIVHGAGLDALSRGTIQFSPDGKRALCLANYRKFRAAQNGGILSVRDRNYLIRYCKRLGFSQVWIKFVLGVQ